MTVNALQVLRIVFVQVWRLFTGWHIPGTNVTPAAWALFFFAALCALRFSRRIINPGNGGSDE